MEMTQPFLVAADHPALAGHFPGHPVVPGVVLLDQVVLAIRKARGLGRPLALSQAKFLAPTGPGDELSIVHADSASDKAAGTIRFEVRRGDTRVATGTLRLETDREGAA